MGCQCSKEPGVKPRGQDIRDEYRIGKLLGSGAFGQVRECTRRCNGELLAVKIMERKSREVGHWSNESMFRREVQLLGLLDNPSIVRYVDFYEDKHFLYAVIERCEGGELFEQIIKCKRFNERDASYLCRQMLNAVAYVHSIDIVHRDIKAENFMFKYKDIDSELKLIDFGMSARTAFLTEVCGSPHYLAPELIKRRYGSKADMWALGVLIYLMLYGRYPFDGSSTEAIVKQILTKPIDYSAGSIQLSDEAISFMKRLLERDPKKRSSAVEALEHKWVEDTEEHQRRRERAAMVKDDASPDLIECVRSAHRKVTAHRRSGVSKKAEARRNHLLQQLEKKWAQGKTCGGVRVSPLNQPPQVKPEFLRRGKRMNTTPSRYLASKLADFQALRLAVEVEPPCSPEKEAAEEECHTGSTAIEQESTESITPQYLPDGRSSKWFNDEGTFDWDAAERDITDHDGGGSKSTLVSRERRRVFTVHVYQKDVVDASQQAAKEFAQGTT